MSFIDALKFMANLMKFLFVPLTLDLETKQSSEMFRNRRELKKNIPTRKATSIN